jgi:5-methylcytosine-specific restriction protein A
MLGGLAEAVDELVGTDLGTRCDSELRETLIAARREIDRLEAFVATLVLAVHRRGIPAGDGATSTPAWVQWQTGQRFSDARASLDAGRACESLPKTAKAWAQGEISASAARTICRGLRDGHADVYATMEDDLVDRAAERDLRGLDVRIRHYQSRCDALDGTEPADQNGLYLSRVGNRVALSADLDALTGRTVAEAVAAATDPPCEGDDRSPAWRRADALARVCRFFLDHADLPVEGGERPHLAFVLKLDTRTGQLETTGDTALSPAQIDRLLCDAKISTIVVGADGNPLDVGAATYRPSRAVRRAVIFRDGHCRYPGCDRRPSWCEVHHVIPFPHGPTAPANLVLLCDHHHDIVHKPGWHATFDGTTFTVTNPHGRIVGSTVKP